jgi:hypothetical protein
MGREIFADNESGENVVNISAIVYVFSFIFCVNWVRAGAAGITKQSFLSKECSGTNVMIICFLRFFCK